MNVRREARRLAVDLIIDTVAEAVKELGSVPSGHLYAALTGVLNLTEYNMILAILQARGDVQLHGHVISWVGPS